MKEGWTYRKLSDVCSQITDGSHFSPKEDKNGRYPMLSVKDMDACGFNYNSCKFINEDDYQYLVANGCKPSKNDVLVAKDGSYLKTAFVQVEDIEQAILSSIAILKPKTNILSPFFLTYFFKAPHTKEVVEKHYLTGTAIKRVILKGFKALSIPIPSLAEQERIVAELDLLTGIIDKQKAQLKELDTLARSIFYDMFGDPVENEKGWDIKEMRELFDIGSSKRVFESQWTESGVPFYRAREIVKLSKDEPIDSPIYISEELFKEYSTKYGIPSEGDIMITAVGTLGTSYIVRKSDRFYFKDGNILWFKNKGLCESRFIRDEYETDYVKNQIQGNANAAVVGTYTIMNANKTKVIVPPIMLQTAYIKKVEAIDRQKASIKRSTADTQKLFDYTMDKYFG